jgi:hypothetical protein
VARAASSRVVAATCGEEAEAGQAMGGFRVWEREAERGPGDGGSRREKGVRVG